MLYIKKTKKKNPISHILKNKIFIYKQGWFQGILSVSFFLFFQLEYLRPWENVQGPIKVGFGYFWSLITDSLMQWTEILILMVKVPCPCFTDQLSSQPLSATILNLERILQLLFPSVNEWMWTISWTVHTFHIEISIHITFCSI